MDTSAAASAASSRPDRWGEVCAQLSKAGGGKPGEAVPRPRHRADDRRQPSLRLRQNQGRRPRRTAPSPPGNRRSWAHRRHRRRRIGPPHSLRVHGDSQQRINHTAVSVNAGPARAWRAPNNPQASYLTCCALEDLAAKLNMDPVEFSRRTLSLHRRARDAIPLPARQSRRAGRMEEALASARPGVWHGPVKRGLGIGINTWGGGGPRQQVPRPPSTPMARWKSKWAPRIWAPAPAPSSPRWPPKRSACPSSAYQAEDRRQQAARSALPAVPPPSAASPPPPANPP